MVTLNLSNSDFKELLQHLITAYEHYQEYDFEGNANKVQLLIGALIINSDEK